MDTTIIHNTREFILLLTGACALLSIVGGVGFWILKTKFVPRAECLLEQEKCHANVCKKIDEIKEMLKAHAIARNVEQQLFFRRSNAIDQNFMKIAAKLNYIQPENPIHLKDMPTQ